MAIEQRGSSFQVTINHKGSRYRRQFQSLVEAQVWEGEGKLALLKGDLPDLGQGAKAADKSKPRTMQELYDYTHDHFWGKSRSAQSSGINGRHVTRLLGPTTMISRVDVFSINKLAETLRSTGNSNATVNRKLAALSKMLTVAVDLDIIPKKPKIKKTRETERRRFRIDPELEYKMLSFFERLGQADMCFYVILSLDAGLRQSEATGLRFTQVDERIIMLFGEDTKAYKTRSVPMTSRLVRMVQERRAAAVDPSSRVLRGLTKRTIQYYWGLLREHLALEEEKSFVPHILRHEFCSRIADRTGNAPAIMKLAGHSSLLVSQRYINLAASGLDGIIASLNRPEAA